MLGEWWAQCLLRWLILRLHDELKAEDLLTVRCSLEAISAII